MSSAARVRAAGAAAALLWPLLGLGWFDDAAGWRPAWLERLPHCCSRSRSRCCSGSRWPYRARRAT